MSEILIRTRYVAILFSIQLAAFAGGHRGVVTPVPIPNTEVKGSFAEGSAGLARARVGRRRLFYFLDLERLATPRPAWEKHPVLQVFFLHAASDHGCLFVFDFPLKGLSPQQKGLSLHF